MDLHRSNLRTLGVLLTLALALLMPAQQITSAGAEASSDPVFEFLASTGGTVGAVDVESGFAYLTEGAALTILDVRAPAQPRRVGQAPLPGCTTDVQVVGQLAYVFLADTYCAYPHGLQIIDVGDRTSPMLRYVADSAVAVQVVGGLAYIVGDDGLQIVDVSSPAQLVALGHYAPTGGSALEQVQVAGTQAYLISYGGLEIVDVRNPQAPALLGSYPTTETLSMLQVVGSLVYAVGAQGLKIIDVSRPGTPTLRGSYQLPGQASWVQVVGTIAYVTFGSAGAPNQLLLFDVRDPGHPALRGYYSASAEIHIAQVAANYAYIAAFDANSAKPVTEFSIIDMSDPGSPFARASYTIAGNVRDMGILDGLAYLAVDPGGLQIIDLRDTPSSPHVVGTYGVGQAARFVKVIDDLAYVSDGIQIIDVHDPADPVLLGNVGTPGWRTDIRDAQVANGMAYVTSLSDPGDGSRIGELSIIDVTNRAHPVPRAGYTVMGEIISAQIVGGVAYIAAGKAGFQIVDVSNPDALALLGTYTTAGPVSSVQVRGDLAYVIQDSTLLIIDVHDPAHPTLRGTYTAAGLITSLQIEQSQGYLVWKSTPTGGQLDVLDLHNLTAPTLLGSYGITSEAPIYTWPSLRQIVNGRVYITSSGYFKGRFWGELKIVDVNDPTTPRLAGSYSAGGPINSLQVAGNLVYLGYLSPSLFPAGGFAILDLSTLPALTARSTYSMPSSIVADVVDDRAYVGAASNGIRILRLHTELLPAAATITPAGGSLTTHDGGLSVSFPAGAVTSTAIVTYTGQLAPSHPTDPRRGVVRSFRIDAQTSAGQPLAQLGQPATLVLSYTHGLLASRLISDERTLNLIAWDGRAWTDLLPCDGCLVDTLNNRVIVSTSLLTEFALVGDRQAYFLPIIVRR